LLTGYVVSFNRRHARHGPLFQNRFKSIVCQEDIYLKELVRYIHLNPLRAGIVPDLSRLTSYKYGGHSALMGSRDCAWMDTAYVFSHFGKAIPAARRAYGAYVREGVESGRRPELVNGGLIRSSGGWEAVKISRWEGAERLKGDQRILGEDEFVLNVLKEASETFERRHAMKRLGYDLTAVEDRVCELLHIERGVIFSKSREKVKADARALFCFWAVRELGHGQQELARKLGMTQPGVGYAVLRGEVISKMNQYQLES